MFVCGGVARVFLHAVGVFVSALSECTTIQVGWMDRCGLGLDLQHTILLITGPGMMVIMMQSTPSGRQIIKLFRDRKIFVFLKLA